MTKPMTQYDLEHIGCAEPGCTCREVVLSSECHPRAGVLAIYDKDTGVLMLECAVCREPVVEVEVDPGECGDYGDLAEECMAHPDQSMEFLMEWEPQGFDS